MTFNVNSTTRVDIEGVDKSTINDLKMGQIVEIEYVPSTKIAVKVNIKQPEIW